MALIAGGFIPNDEDRIGVNGLLYRLRHQHQRLHRASHLSAMIGSNEPPQVRNSCGGFQWGAFN